MAGIDIGAVATKSVILGSEIMGHAILPTGFDGRRAAENALNASLKKMDLSPDKLGYVVSTGYGRRNVTFADEFVTEITAHAKGVRNLFPRAMTVIDIGGQDSKALSLSEDGRVRNFVMNDKCAAGTGRFLEVMARTLDLNLEELGVFSLRSNSPAEISSMCTVFSESEVISLLTQGRSREDIVAGLHRSISKRIAGMAKQVGVREEVVFTGGVAKDVGMRASLEKELGVELRVPEEPQITGALGAAIIAKERLIMKG